MADALRTKDLQAWKDQNRRKPGDRDDRAPEKTWGQLTDKEKDDVLKRVAIRAGLVKKDP